MMERCHRMASGQPWDARGRDEVRCKGSYIVFAVSWLLNLERVLIDLPEVSLGNRVLGSSVDFIFSFFSIEDGTQGLKHAGQAFCH